MLKAIVGLFKAINKNSNPREIAHAVCCAMLLGFLPKDNALWYIIFVFCLFLRIQKGAYLIFTLLFSLFASILDPVFDKIGYAVLTIDSLQGFFVFLMKLPLFAYTKFYNSIVMGSLLSSLVLYVPVYFGSVAFVQLWRTKLIFAVRKLKIVGIVSKIPLAMKIKELM